MNRQEYLETARDNAVNQAFNLRMKELRLPTSERRPLRLARMRLLDNAALYQTELIVIDAQHTDASRPTQTEKAKMAELRDRVNAARKANLRASTLLAIAGDVLAMIENIRGVGA